MNNPRVQTIAAVFEYASKSVLDLAQGLPEHLRMVQPRDGKGHPLWHVGHLARGNDNVVNQWCLDAEPIVPRTYAAKFGPAILGGEPVTSDPANYPAWQEVMENYQRVNESLIQLLAGLPDAELEGPMKGKNVPPPAHQYFGNLGKALIYMATHMTHHRGQLALIQSMNA